MDKHKYKSTFEFFLEKIENKKINWALTGSYRLFLENNQFFNNSDIDILTDKLGAILIKTLFADRVISEFRYLETNGLRSYFGQLQINDITFDVMCDVQNRINGRWCNIPNLNHIEYFKMESYEFPVLPLTVEYNISKSLNQGLKKLRINEIISIKNGLQQRV